jgi:hypothetical protein
MDEEWLRQYKLHYLQLGAVLRRLNLCSTASYWHLRHLVEARVQSLQKQHTSVGRGYGKGIDWRSDNIPFSNHSQKDAFVEGSASERALSYDPEHH